MSSDASHATGSPALETFVDILRRRAEETPDLVAYTFLRDGETDEVTLRYGDLDQRARGIAAELRRRGARPGDRAVLLHPPGIEFIPAFFGCLYAGVVAVPSYPPDPSRLDRTLPRLRNIVRDSGALLALTTRELLAFSKPILEHAPELAQVVTFATEEIPAAEGGDLPARSARDVAFLQYTSGSTGTPKGVVVTHGNLVHNSDLIRGVAEADAGFLAVGWLPLYHDMGLIGTVLQPCYLGARAVLMSPLHFLQRPARWLEALSRFRGTASPAPNFAYDLCVRKVSPEERAGLDLSSWRVALNGAEPLRAATFERFAAAFGPCGFRPEAFLPCYGLAEATLIVSGTSLRKAPATLSVSRRALEAGRAEPRRDDASADVQVLVSSGPILGDQDALIVDPARLSVCSDAEVGEIWLAGASVATGYWGRPEESAAVFGAHLADGRGPYLRTGDLGFRRGAELFVTGRLKDLIVVRGMNHYPQDLEATVEHAHPALRAGCGVAFAIEHEGEERAVVVHEIDPKRAGDPLAVGRLMHKLLAEAHGLSAHEIVLIEPRTIPKTSSGKLRRRDTREAYLAGGLAEVARWRSDGMKSSAMPREGALSPDAAPDRARSERRIAAILGEQLGIDPAALDRELPFADLGLDSAQAVMLAGALEESLGRPLSSTVVWDHPTIAALAAHLAGVPSRAERTGPAHSAAAEPLAIVGIACRFPGAPDRKAFWELIRDGRDAIREVPPERWDADLWCDPDPLAAGKMNTRWGGFLEDVDRFDARFFGISPREAAEMDPQQRILLEVVWDALEDAGIVASREAAASVGVFVGISGTDYQRIHLAEGGRIEGYSLPGNAHSMAANRLSYLLGLGGPSVSVDTACSSSLVAFHLACRSIRAGECDRAIVAGVNLILDPTVTVAFSKGGFMAADGRCKTFDARADGYVRAEGCGVVVIERLQRARAEGDRVYALVRGSAMNNDGPRNGLTAPSAKGQEAVLRSAYRDAGVDPHRVAYVEAHGTGTQLGDPIEARALGAVLGSGRQPDESLRLGSVKANIGHCEPASGMAGLIKAALALHEGVIPPSLHFETPNSHIPFEELGLRVVREPEAWPEDRRLAGVNSFGFGGTNAHVILEGEPPNEALSPAAPLPGPHLLALSAHDGPALKSLAGAWGEWLRAAPEPPLAEALWTAALRRQPQLERLAVLGDSAQALASQLAAFAAGETPRAVHLGRARDRRLAFVFSGQGSQWAGMGRELFESEPVFREAFAEVEALFAAEGLSDLRARVFAQQESRLSDTELAQPAIFTIQWALAAFWRWLGVEPLAVVGHSVGELAAAAVSGALRLEDAVRVVRLRGQLMQRAAGGGRMLAVALSGQEAAHLVVGHGANLSVAAVNSRHSVVLSGATTAIEGVRAELEARGVGCKLVPVDYAFHSVQMEPARAEIEARLADLEPRAAAVPFVSTVTGTELEGSSLSAAYWGRNLREPVRFGEAVASLRGLGVSAFLELGGHPVLGLDLREGADDGREPPVLVAASLRRGSGEREAIRTSFGALWAGGVSVDWRRLLGSEHRVVALPAYPWQRERHWFTKDAARAPRASEAGHPLLARSIAPSGLSGTRYWEAELDLVQRPELGDHRVGDAAVVPAATWIDVSMAAAAALFGEETRVLEEFTLERALGLPESGTRSVQVVIVRRSAQRSEIELSSRAANSAADVPWTLHARGALLLDSRDASERPACEDLEALAARCAEPLDVDAFYEALAERGLRYGPAFRSVTSLQRGPAEALGRLRLPGAWGAPTHQPMPAPLLDGAFQLVAAALGESVGSGSFVPVGVRRFALAGEPARELLGHARVEKVADDALEAEVRLLDTSGRIVAEVSGLRLVRLEASTESALDAWLHHLAWRPCPQASDTPDAARFAGAEGKAEGTWLLLEDAAGVGAGFRARLESRGFRCIGARVGAGFRPLGGDRYEVNPDRPEDLQELLKHALGNGHGACRGVLHLWSLDSASTDADPATAATDLCVGVLHLVQALARAGLRDAPRLWIATRGAQATFEEDGPRVPASAALWGLARVVAREHPELGCTRIDLDPDAPERDLDVLESELLAPDREDEIAWRRGERLGARLATGLPRSTEASERREPADGRPFRLETDAPGILDRLGLRATTLRPPGPGEVTLRVRAAGLNFKDVLLALGVVPSPVQGVVPLGGECAGIIEAVGPEVDGFAPGDEVVALGGFCLASHVTTRACLVAAKPEHLSFEAAATLPIVFLTAHHALHTLGRMRAGERVLVHSATGGVGLAALQLAERAGAEVFGTAGTPEKRALLRERGVRHVMDSRTLDFADEVREATAGRGVDLVLNSLSGEAIEKNFEALAPYGRFLEIGIRDIYENRRIGLWPFHKSLSYFSVDLSRMLLERPEELGTALRELMGAFARRELEPLPVEQADLVDASSVFRTMAQARHIGKLVLRVDPDAPVAAERVEGLRADGSYLVTGGLGGLGLAVAEWMVGQGARHLLLLGRRPPGTAAGAILARLRERGATIEVVQGDVSQEATGDAVRGALARIARPLRGVIHAAGILDDGVLLRQSPVRFETVMAPKARGAWNVHAWTREAPLDFFVLFSSAAALLGSPGQGNYCAANGFLDGLAHALRRAGRPACAVSFGPWAEVGMAADAALRGLESLSPDRGTEALGRILASAVAQATVLRLDLRQFVQVLPQAAELPLLDELRRDAALEVRVAGPSPVRAELLAIPSRAARERHLSGFVGGQVAAVLGLDPGAVDERQPLTDMGLDSLLALELRNRCEAGLGVQLSPTLLWSHPTLEALVPELARRMGVELEVDPGGESEDDDADAYEGRSAEELALALAQRLDGLAEEGTA